MKDLKKIHKKAKKQYEREGLAIQSSTVAIAYPIPHVEFKQKMHDYARVYTAHLDFEAEVLNGRNLLVNIKHGIVFPSMSSFNNSKFFNDVLDYCQYLNQKKYPDSLRIIAYYLDDLLGQVDGKDLDENLNELTRSVNNICYISNIKEKRRGYLGLYLKLIKFSMSQIGFKNGTVLVRLSAKQFEESGKTYKESGWKIKKIDDTLSFAYVSI